MIYCHNMFLAFITLSLFFTFCGGGRRIYIPYFFLSFLPFLSYFWQIWNTEYDILRSMKMASRECWHDLSRGEYTMILVDGAGVGGWRKIEGDGVDFMLLLQ